MLTKALAVAAILGVAAPVAPAGAGSHGVPDPEYGVFLKLADNVPGSFDEVVARLSGAFYGYGWEVIAQFESGVDEGDCAFRAKVVVVNSAEYSSQVMRFGRDAAFALPLRLGVFEDERGIQIAAVNPLSLNRTIISETEFAQQSEAIVEELRDIGGAAFPNNISQTQYGQMRDEGLISRTMGLIAGGPFESKLETIYRGRLEDGENLSAFGNRLATGLNEMGGSWRWGIRAEYVLDLAAEGVMVIGVTGEDMEARSFQIVGSGGDGSRSDFACAGIDHSPAYPIELVISMDGDRVEIRAVDSMFRMKMFFEDAGNMKFAANMRMPGTIEDEIRDKVEEVLNQ